MFENGDRSIFIFNLNIFLRQKKTKNRLKYFSSTKDRLKYFSSTKKDKKKQIETKTKLTGFLWV